MKSHVYAGLTAWRNQKKTTQIFFAPLFQARMVAAATSNLCEAANASVQGHASEEKLISSAKHLSQ